MTSDAGRPKVVIAERLPDSAIDALGDAVDVIQIDGTDRTKLLAVIEDADALIVRSATRVDDELFNAAPKLRAVARAGVGLDNVDVERATNAGVMVINAPTSNIVSAAELAVTHILAGLRRVAEADASIRAGLWERSRLTGVELSGKTVGIVGFGRIGQLVAQRLRPFDVHLLCFDPYVPRARAADGGAEPVGLDDLMERSDVVTVHMPKTPETEGMIGERELSLAKPHLHIVNAARGGLIDERALVQALSSRRIGSAAIDVYSEEPPHASPVASKLLELPNVTLTPHLGASTAEAQERAGVAVAKSIRLALAEELVPDAVNVAGGRVSDLVRPAIALADALGQLVTFVGDAALTGLEVRVSGELARDDVSVLKLAALRGAFRSLVSEPVSYVNAPVFAKDRGVAVDLHTSDTSPRFTSGVSVRGSLSNGTAVEFGGIVASKTGALRLTAVDEHELDLPLSPHLLFLRYQDRAGVIGQIGAILGESETNIAGMQVSRPGAPGSEALVVLNLDGPCPADLAARISEVIGARAAAPVTIEI